MSEPSLDLEVLRGETPEPEDGGEATRLRVHESVKRARVLRIRVRRVALVGAALGAVVALSFLLRTETATQPSAPEIETPQPSEVPDRPAGASSTPPHETTPIPSPGPHTPAGATALDKAGGPASTRPATAAQPAAPRTHARRPGPLARRPVVQAPAAAQAPAVVQAPVVVQAPELGKAPDDAPAEPPAPTYTPQQLHALYMTAHRLHFRGAPRDALAAWDAYLAGAPEGPAAAEARFNRAVTLLRLGRKDEARAALEPFEAGAYGQFRRSEASRLLQTLP